MLVVVNKVMSETDVKGIVTVFFELNGQPRRVKVPNCAKGAPMPGVVSTVAVSQGQNVKTGDVLLAIEAMKMETAIHAKHDGSIAEVLVIYL